MTSRKGYSQISADCDVFLSKLMLQRPRLALMKPKAVKIICINATLFIIPESQNLSRLNSPSRQKKPLHPTVQATSDQSMRFPDTQTPIKKKPPAS
ncbi:hypothetical protein BK132_32155 [Paenibacillus sp. FSL H8-0259]|nr:hypothetical protein BK132_32155 [Paenibacillus sp. FSL H8-0259]